MFQINSPPTIALDSFTAGQFSHSWRFHDYLCTYSALTPEQVVPVLAAAEAATKQGYYAVGFVAYEAAAALSQYLPALPPQDGLPLAWFALFGKRCEVVAGEGLPQGAVPSPQVTPECCQMAYDHAVSRIHEAIGQGETYQINYTFTLQGNCQLDPLPFYRQLLQSQQPAFGAFLQIGSHTILSASPELFFSVQDGVITTRPMKGTASRGRYPAEDVLQVQCLRNSPKEQAENLMIVDLLRNDLGQIAKTGSVQTTALFDVESYPTVHQMTSTIAARLQPETGMVDIFRALFPCGSVTGAPKRSSMALIAELEAHPRGVYCGAIGYLAPEGEACFSVAIRTLLLDHHTNRISMGVGSGITWDAEPLAEYAECLTKAVFLQQGERPRLLESLLLVDGVYPRLEHHLERLCWSAGRLGYVCDRQRIRQVLLGHAGYGNGVQKTRLLLAINGDCEIESSALQPLREPLRIAVSAHPVDPDDLMLYFKTEQRELYDAARCEYPAADEVLLCNAKGELTEGSFTNLVLKLDNRLVTPPLACGLLPGIMRQELLEQGIVSEQVLYPADLLRADEIWLINSVRGWLWGELTEYSPTGQDTYIET